MRGASTRVKSTDSSDRVLREAMGGMMMGSNEDDTMMITLSVTNLSFEQPFSPFFVMVHNDEATPLYVAGTPSSMALARLAEDGSPGEYICTKRSFL
jgi:hypothetical protein